MFGGWHIGSVKDSAEAIRIMHAAVDEGLTFFDNCWDYHDGGSEEVMGRALADGRRDKVFLMTKNCERDPRGREVPRRQPAAPPDGSHRPLAVPRNGLPQRSGLGIRQGRPQSRIGGAEGRQGALHRVYRPQDPRIHLSMLAKPFDWDACQFPVNALDVHYGAFRSRCCLSA